MFIPGNLKSKKTAQTQVDVVMEEVAALKELLTYQSARGMFRIYFAILISTQTMPSPLSRRTSHI
jgi:hypothetical protein